MAELTSPPELVTDIVFCLPANFFQNVFVRQLLDFMNWLMKKQFKFYINIQGTSNVSLVRDMCVGVTEDHTDIKEFIKPFQGKIQYKHIMWIDSDILFKPSDFEMLLEDDKDVVSGFYKKNPQAFAMTRLDDMFTKAEQVLCLSDMEVAQQKELIPAAAFGLGFCLMKQGVLEKIPRPWFNTQDWTFPSGKKVMLSEDTYFCLKAMQNGFKLWLDPRVRCGHVKQQAWF